MLNPLNETAPVAQNPETAPQSVFAKNSKDRTSHQTLAENAEKTEASDIPALKKAMEKANKRLEEINIERRFEIDEELKRPIVKVINAETKEIIRQIPTEEAIRISKSVNEMIGLLLDDRI